MVWESAVNTVHIGDEDNSLGPKVIGEGLWVYVCREGEGGVQKVICK